MVKTDYGRDALRDRPRDMDTVETALLTLTQMVATDSARLESLDHKLDAVMEHLGVAFDGSDDGAQVVEVTA